ncbi:MAG: DNA polymerase III subunit gamma/tau [Eubacterium sp.]|nr:DNA polymerase III subunit gamma/tau [Eubacterium sp.]
MAYVALYRKFRPDTFEEVKGQEPIVTTLKNQVKHDRIGHAYLFCGTRGTGKTSVAKLMARAVNCQHPVDGSPCGECESCRRIAAGNAMNVIEIDAASNNGVDNIRQINEGVQYAPTDGKYMVYIIDEVHMLSAGAFNAMLKTLEEPPSYVIFILATTESHKVPVTIRSRCQRYDFRRIEYTTIADRMEDLLQRENVPATREALEYIARAADGSMRDALSILDECVSYHLGEELTLDRVLGTIGAVDTEVFERLTEKIGEDDPVAVMELIHEVVWKGTDLTRFVDDYVWFLRNLLFLALSPGLGSQLDLTEEKVQLLTELGKRFSHDTLQRQLHVMQEMSMAIRGSSNRRVTLEMGMIRLMRPETDVDLSGMLGRMERLEQRAEKAEAEAIRLSERVMELEQRPAGPVAASVISEGKPAEPEEIPETKPEECREMLRKEYPAADAEDLIRIAESWRSEILPRLSPVAKNYMKRIAVVPAEARQGEEPKMNLVLTGEDVGGLADDYFTKPENMEELGRIVAEATGCRIRFQLARQEKITRRESVLDLSKIHFDTIEDI